MRPVKFAPEIEFDLEEAVAALQIFARRVVNDLSHGICAQCEAEVTSSLR